MTDKLDRESLDSLIKYRLEKASETLSEAELLKNNRFYNAAVNRLYYAAYYAASALMLGNKLEVATHSGIKTMLGMKFVQPGILEREYGRAYQRLFDSRQAADYEDFVINDIDTYEELYPLAVKFIDRVAALIYRGK